MYVVQQAKKHKGRGLHSVQYYSDFALSNSKTILDLYRFQSCHSARKEKKHDMNIVGFFTIYKLNPSFRFFVPQGNHVTRPWAIQ